MPIQPTKGIKDAVAPSSMRVYCGEAQGPVRSRPLPEYRCESGAEETAWKIGGVVGEGTACVLMKSV